MKITAISDTHTKHAGLALPGGDVLIHAGNGVIIANQNSTPLQTHNTWARIITTERMVVILSMRWIPNPNITKTCTLDEHMPTAIIKL
jgi:hypothetical protein